MMSDGLREAIEKHRKHYSDKYHTALIANAYIAQLDEQAALAVPYDWEWLESRPEFEEGLVEWLLQTRVHEFGGLLKVARNTDGSFTWFVEDIDEEMVYIRDPATKGDVIKLLEVFS